MAADGTNCRVRQHNFLKRHVLGSVQQTWSNRETSLIKIELHITRVPKVKRNQEDTSVNKRKPWAVKYLQIVDAKTSKQLLPALGLCNPWKPIERPLKLGIYQCIFRLHLGPHQTSNISSISCFVCYNTDECRYAYGSPSPPLHLCSHTEKGTCVQLVETLPAFVAEQHQEGR